LGRAEPNLEGRFDAVAASVSSFLTRGLSLLRRLPALGARSDHERAVAEAIGGALDGVRERFLHTHVEQLYDEITEGLKRSPISARLTSSVAAGRASSSCAIPAI
jgi:(3,5-dihydroxyphenyl)acetyl-CoA 1,2-dioxygenase